MKLKDNPFYTKAIEKKFPIGNIFYRSLNGKPAKQKEKNLYIIVGYQHWDCEAVKFISNPLAAVGPVVTTINCLLLNGPQAGTLHGFSSGVLCQDKIKTRLHPSRLTIKA